jgi:hypothetical protein
MQARTFTIAFVSAALAVASPCRADQDAYIPDKFKGVILYAPQPIYYTNSRLTGIYRLTINQKTGTVDEVAVINHAEKHLDSTAVVTFFKCKFRPGAIKQLDVPVLWDRQATCNLKKAVSR